MGQCPRASQLLILLPHSRGAHHSSGYRRDPAVLLHCCARELAPRQPSPVLSYLQHSCPNTGSTPSGAGANTTISSGSLSSPKNPQSDHQQAGNPLGVGAPGVSALHPPASSPGAATQGWWWHRSPPGSCWWGVPGCLPASGCVSCTSLSSKPAGAGSSTPGI